ncbi:MAG TPA: hypothetical protein VFZ76_16790 [Anaerolineales bacterium]
MNTRYLGILCIVGNVIALVGAWVQLDDNPGDNIFGLLWGIGVLAGLVGLILGNAVGSNPVVRAVAFLPIIAVVSGIVVGIAVQFGATTYDSILSAFSYFGWLAGMILVSILTIAAKTWAGWRRFAPLVVLVMAFFIQPGINTAGGLTPISLALGYTVGQVSWTLLGYVVATTEPAPARAQSATA